MYPLVSVVILNWNGEQLIEDCICSTNKINYKNLEIIVVDNNSTDKSKEIIQKFPHIKLIQNSSNLGFAAGMNIGIKNSKGKYVATLNNDVELDSNWLKRPIEILESNDSIGIISCRQMVHGHKNKIDVLYNYINHYLLPQPKNNGYYNDKFSEKEGYVFGASGASAIYRRLMLEKTGLFDERFFAYHEESDLHTRALFHGWKCFFVPSSIVFHKGSQSFNKMSPVFHYYHERNRWWYIWKNFPLSIILKNFFWIIMIEFRIFRVITFKSKCPLIYFRAKYRSLKGLSQFTTERKFVKANDILIKKLINVFLKHKTPIPPKVFSHYTN